MVCRQQTGEGVLCGCVEKKDAKCKEERWSPYVCVE